MKKYLYLFLILSAFNCKSYREFLELEHYNVVNAKDTLVDGQYINGFINNRKVKFFLDTGATNSVIQNLEILGGEGILKTEIAKKLISAKGADGKELSLHKIKTQSLETNTYKSKNRYIITFNKEQSKFVCIKGINKTYDAILGLDAFVHSETPILLDYDNNIIAVLDELPKLVDFKEMDVEIKNNRIMLNSEINNCKIPLLFDTGNNSFIVISQNLFPNDIEDISYESGMFTANNRLSYPKNRIYMNRNVNIGGLESGKNQINVVESFKTNGVGLQFINKYNWIIDFKHKKVYAKKIKDFASKSLEKMAAITYMVVEIDGRLVIFHKNDPENKFNVGDKIVSVNGITISNENMCELQDILNASNDWNEFKIETKAK